MKLRLGRLFFIATMMFCFCLSEVLAQVCNDNEFSVNLVDENSAYEHFVPGELIVKFKEETPVRVKRARGRYASTSVSSLDGVLSKYNVAKFDKLLPEEVYKPRAARRSAVAPDGRSVTEHCLDLLFHIQIESDKPDSVMMLVEELKTLGEVEYAEPNYYYYISGAPAKTQAINLSTQMTTAQSAKASTTDENVICANPEQNPLYQLQWGIKALNIDQLWNKPIVNSKRPVIAILDTGVDINHPDLKDNIWSNPREEEGKRGYDDDGNGFVDDVHGWDFVYDYHEMYDNNSHGTHVAGIAAASDNAIGIIGANPKALIMPVKVMDDDGRGDLATIIKGINYAAKEGADVINMSIGGQMSISMAEALENAYITSVIVAAAGNSSKNIYDNTGYPAAYYCVIGVQATCDAQGTLADFSNYDSDGPIFSHKPWNEDAVREKDPTVILGINYETKAPGTNIVSTVLDGKYAMYNGTSMSSPLVAGAISALKMVKEGLSNEALMADLAHLDCDFAKVYSDDPRKPDMYLAGMVIDDEVEGNKYPDGEIDAGETLLLYPILLNGWGQSGKVNMHLEIDSNSKQYVKIDNPDVDFGYSLGAYGHLKSKNPFIVHISDSLDNDAKIKFIFSCSSDNFNRQYEYYESIKKFAKIAGIINKDTVLTAGIEWYIPYSLVIMKEATLTIEPGTHLNFEKDAKITSFGHLIAEGTPEKPITFTGYKGARWGGIESHPNEDVIWSGDIFRNEEGTKYTLKKTDETPIEETDTYIVSDWYYAPGESIINREFRLENYLEEAGYSRDYTYKQELLTDPNFLTPFILKIKEDFNAHEKECERLYSKVETEEKYNVFRNTLYFGYSALIFGNPMDKLSYCKISNGNCLKLNMDNCEITQSYNNVAESNTLLRNCNIVSSVPKFNMYNQKYNIKYSNIINNWMLEKYSVFAYCNYFNNSYEYNGNNYILGFETNNIETDYSKCPSYLGTSREDYIRPYIYEAGNAPTSGRIDISNMPSKPYAEAHGILWKILVDGKDCQDEFEQMDPLGVGIHKVELYFNRPMNVAKTPEISFGLKRPFTSNVLTEEGVWSRDSLVYSVNLRLTGRESSDGLNRFFVRGAEDNEFFECPYESTRFNILIQTAGTLATGFMADAKLGCVALKWNNEHNDFSDAMGFNVYRYTVNKTTNEADTIRINRQILPIETSEYIDDDVISGETYNYFYRVLSSELKEYDVSNTVAATPLTAIKGDANASGNVDVADVITTVNYATGMKPKPFIYEAADINSDEIIDIMDVVGIIQTIISPESQLSSISDATAIYTVEDGILYVNSPVALAGVQVQLATEQKQEITVLEILKDFEQASAWLSDNDWLFIAYSLSGKTLPAGKTALLNIGNARITDMRLSDVTGKNVKAIGQNVTGVAHMGGDVMHIEGVYNLSGRKLYTNERTLDKLPNGVYIVNGKKVVK